MAHRAVVDALPKSSARRRVPLYDGGNQGVRRRQLHEMFRQPGYDSMLTARGDIPPWE